MIIMRSPLRSRSAGERISLRTTVNMAVSSSRQPSTITLISTLITASCYMLALHLESP